MRALAGLILAGGLATAAVAEAPAVSTRPAPRPEAAEIVVASAGVAGAVVSAMAPSASLRPQARPRLASVSAAPEPAVAIAPAPAATAPKDPVAAFFQSLTGTRPAAAATPIAGASALAVARSIRPEERPSGNGLARLVSAITPPRATSRKGSVCGLPEIKGEALGPIPGRGACGIDQPVRITSVSGVAVAQQPTIDCTTAKALNAWVRDGVIPAVGRTGGGVARVNIIAHYSCRTRNNRSGAKLSEHSYGHAVDVSGVTLKDGTTLTVLEHWSSRKYGKIIKAMHSSACGPFGTVLGPNSDSYHSNHLHVDTARYRGGPYCR
jgi:hypothetical protein